MRTAFVLVVVGCLVTGSPSVQSMVAEPPNAAATVAASMTGLSLAYEGRTIVAAAVDGGGAAPERRQVTSEAAGAVTQVVKWTATGRGRVTVTAVVSASADAIAVEVDRGADTLPLVRTSIGPSHNLRNRAVYDRTRDWVVSIDAGATLTVTPVSASTTATSFQLTASGAEVVLRFRPRYYQKHRGLKYFMPWTFQPWKSSVAGWTSWYAFRDSVTQKDITETAAVIKDTLAPFGYEYVQIDDGFQQDPIGVPEHWLQTNAKFPGGLEGLKASITAQGLKPGLWTNVSFAQRDYALAHPDYFIKGPDGAPARGNWVGYVMDGSNPRTLADLVLPVYRALKTSGWQYFKVDALRHLKYEGYNSFSDYFTRKQLDRDAVYRQFATAITNAIGPNTFKLMCWGVRPELIGLFDGCRVGNDGFGYGGFSEYNSFNNIVWRNDPDHIELTQADAYRATTITSLTGSLLMLTDPPAVYRTERVEAARRASPVLFAQPGQIYDVEPSRSDAIGRAAVEMSGSGPRSFDATQSLSTHYLYAVDVSRAYENWMVLARTGGDPGPIRFGDIGLASDLDYLVFEFWTKSLLGTYRRAFTPGPVDSRFGVQAICLREKLAHPQLVATNRHVSCGAVDVSNVTWSGNTLDGTSQVVANDPYEIYLTEPEGFTFGDVRVTGADVLSSVRSGALRVLRLRSSTSRSVAWHVSYQSQDALEIRGAEAPANGVWLDSLDLSKMVQRRGTPRVGKSGAGGGRGSQTPPPLKLGGVTYAHGIGTLSINELIVDLKGEATRFVSMIGIDDAITREGSVTYEIWLDNKKKLITDVLKAGAPPEFVSIDVTGGRMLELVINDGGDTSNSDYADWAGAAIIMKPGSTATPDTWTFPSQPSLPIAASTAFTGAPRIHPPFITGATPGHPFLFRIPASGQAPMTFRATGLPAGLRLDPASGIITGALTNAGRTTVTITASNAKGTGTHTLTVVGGDDALALTPPMGWNSWNVWGGSVDDAKVRAAADAMVSSGLASVGFQYINIDDGWEGKRDANGVLQPNEKFPDMKALVDYVHAKGLKVGIYSSPGPRTCQGLAGSYHHEEIDAKTWAAWGIDLLKHDWCSYSGIAKDDSLAELQKPYFIMRDALLKTGRDIVYSLCQYGMGNVWEWGAEARGNYWRVSGDLTDVWSNMSPIGFRQAGREQWTRPGHYTDPDMLVVGKVGWGPSVHDTRLTPDEQLTHIALWALQAAPLLLGADMAQFDAFTTNLMTNPEVLAVDQDRLVKAASRISQRERLEVWARPLEDGTMAVGLFNRGLQPAEISVTWDELGVKGAKVVRDLWRHTDIGRVNGAFRATVPAHGVVLVKIATLGTR